MKSFIVALMLIAAVSCASRPARKRDISEVFQAQGWSKGADGYAYDVPQAGLTASDPVVEYTYEPEVYQEENYVAEKKYTPEIVQNIAVETPQVYGYTEVEKTVASPVVTAVDTDYLPPKEQNLREYLPPAARRLRFRRRYRLAKRQ